MRFLLWGEEDDDDDDEEEEEEREREGLAGIDVSGVTPAAVCWAVLSTPEVSFCVGEDTCDAERCATPAFSVC